MKVLHVSALAEKGGVEVVLLNILKCLDRSRFSSEVLLLRSGPLVAEVEATGARTHVIETGRVRDVVRGVTSIVNIARLIRSRGINLVHSHNAVAHIYSGLAAAFVGVPALYHLHGVPRFTFSREGMISLLSVLLPARSTVACSAYVAEAFRRAWHSRRDLRVIHNGVMADFSATRDARSVRREFGIPSNAPTIVMAARLQRWKGVHVFLDAAAIVAKEVPDACFLITGGTLFGLEQDYALELHEQTERLNLGKAVRFAGFQPEVLPFYAAADLVVHSSIEPEPFGMVLVEAMACAKPIVASDCGGPREIVESGVTGLLVPPNDAGSLAQAILALLGDRERRTRMGRAGAARALDMFSADRMVESLQAIYEEMVEERTRQ